MDPRLVQQVDLIYEHALSLPTDQRQNYLDQTCADQAEIRGLVEHLINAAQQVLNDTDSTTDDIPRTGFDVSLFQQDLARIIQTHNWVDQRLGPYQLESLAGQGGMGQVYRARRVDGYFEQLVAVKVLPAVIRWVTADGVAADVQQRFRREMRLLGQLKHPHIAQIHDAGVSSDGTAYFVMEWVDGQPITQWCQEHYLNLKARLQLWLQVVTAVQAAHQRLIIHRDIKPANVFVDSKAGVKVLDFGIAQSLQEGNAEPSTSLTMQYAAPELAYTRWFSRHYASPEQLENQAISTASDQYQLGLLLYELITGVSWCASHSSTASSDELSLNLAQLKASIFQGKNNQLDAAGIPDPHHLTADLPCILSQMLQPSAERRYPSLAAVMNDVNAYLQHRPIEGKRGSQLYLAQKFARRHWVPLAASVVAFSLVLAFSAHSIYQARRLALEQKRTVAELHRNEKMLQFIYRLFDDSDPYSKGETAVLAEDIIKRGLARARLQFAEDPLTQAQVLSRMSMTLSHLGDDERALPELLTAAELLEQVATSSLYDQGTVATYIGRTLTYSGDIEGAEKWLLRAVERLSVAAEKNESEDAVDLLAIAYNDLGRVYDLQAQHTQQSAAYHAAKDLEEKYPGQVSTSTRALSLHNLAVLSEDNQQRLAMEKEVLSIRLAEYGENNATVLHTRMIIATLEGLLGHVFESVAQFEQALPRQAQLLGMDHRDRAIQLSHYSRQLLRLGRFDEAVAAAQESLRVNELHRSEDSLYTVLSRINLAQALLMQGHTNAARAQAEAVINYTSSSDNGAYRYCLSAHNLMAETALLRGDEKEARAHLDHCDLDWFSQQTRALPYLAEHYVLASALALRAGEYDYATVSLTKLDTLRSHLNTTATSVDEFKDWRWFELKLVSGLVDHHRWLIHEKSSENLIDPQHEKHLRQAFEQFCQALGEQHWKVRLYEPLVAQALQQHVKAAKVFL